MKQNIKKALRYEIMFILLLFLFCAGVVANINTGSVNISASEIFKIIFFKVSEDQTAYNIIWKIRLPRLLSAAVLGGALSVSGYLLQTFFRNPIAGPFVLGISSGAKMFVGFVMIVLLNYFHSVPLYITITASFTGSMAATLFIILFSKKSKSMSMLLVIGIMIGYICSAITDFFITFAKENDIANLTYWSMGSFSGMNWESFKVASILTAAGFIMAFMLSKPIDAYQMGEGYALSVGINVKSFRVILILISSILSATVTAFAGPISFVGIAVPHISKILFKTSKPIVIIPASFLAGSVFCMYCDLIARTAFAPVELAIGTVTAVFGAPVVIWLMISNKKKTQEL